MKYSPRPFERLLTRFIARQTKIIEQLINQFVSDATMQTTRVLPQKTEGDFFFRDYPALSRQIDTLLRGLSSRLTKTIQAGCEWSWDLANAKNDNMLSKVLDSIGRERVPLKALERWNQKNLPALEAFEKRRIGGMGLSDKVWAYTKGIKGDLELALDLGIGQGMSADRLSRVVREYLKEPNRLYRRVRDEKGVLRLSKSAANYHPGQGVYRSSYKNAVRLTATETNMAYRSADNERMNQMEWILGFEVHISDTNHTCLDSHGVPQPFYDICDELQGRYPKWFRFVGWHPNCYDEESEVYTSNGWKHFADVRNDDLILTINPYSFDLEWSPFKYGIKSQYRGKMVHFFNRSYDALVTPDHEVLGLDKNVREPIFMRTTAEKCGKYQPIYRSSEWIGNHIAKVQIGDLSVPYALFAEFMGYWLSDGSLGHKWAIVVAQQDEHKKAIYDCIAAMGMKPRYNDKSGKVEFNSKDWYIYLQQFGTCADKFIPQEIREATPDQIQIFLDAFISCDGYIKKPRSFVGNRGGICNPTEGERVYFTSSKRMADELGELILKIGRRPSFKIASKAGTVSEFKNGVYATNYDCWTISECRSKTATQYSKEEIDYDGWVYDLVLEKNATMYIRRNGKCFWGSNCRCYITTILPEKDEMIKYLAAMDENGHSSYKLQGEVTDVPPQMKEWLIDNQYRVIKAKSLPYWIKDNPQISISREMTQSIKEKSLALKQENEARNELTSIFQDARKNGSLKQEQIERLHEIAPNVITEGLFETNEGGYVASRNVLHKEIISQYVGDGSVRGDTVYMLGGAPANGKSTVVDSGMIAYPKGVITLDVDKVKRMIPEYGLSEASSVIAVRNNAANFVHEESSYLGKQIQKKVLSSGETIVIDGVNDGSYEKVAKKVATIREQSGGLRVRADYVTCDTEESIRRNQARFERTGRLVRPDVVVHDNAAISKLFPKLIENNVFDELYLWDTNSPNGARLVLRMVGGKLEIIDQELYKRFLAKAGV